jgi:alpha-galactosidase
MKPPMGWNSELVYGCSITEDIVKETAAYIGSTRMNASGYLYVNLGDCW